MESKNVIPKGLYQNDGFSFWVPRKVWISESESDTMHSDFTRFDREGKGRKTRRSISTLNMSDNES